MSQKKRKNMLKIQKEYARKTERDNETDRETKQKDRDRQQ